MGREVDVGVAEGMGGLAEGSPSRCPVSRSRDEVRARTSWPSGSFLGVSGGKGGCLVVWVGVVGGVESPEAFLVRENSLMPMGEGEEEGVLEEVESLEEVRKIPLKLMRWGDLGEDSCWAG